jgi:hypothetical protein
LPVEAIRFFNKIKQCRRVAHRYDKLAANYLAFIKLASIRIWLRANESTPLATRLTAGVTMPVDGGASVRRGQVAAVALKISERKKHRSVPGKLVGLVGALYSSPDVSQQMVGIVDVVPGSEPHACPRRRSAAVGRLVR